MNEFIIFQVLILLIMAVVLALPIFEEYKLKELQTKIEIQRENFKNLEMILKRLLNNE